MTHDDRPGGLRAMAGTTGSLIAALWAGGSTDPVTTKGLPRRYTVGALVAGTGIAVVLVLALSLLRMAIADWTGSTAALSPFWLVIGLAVFLPVLLAYAVDPPRRNAALAIGLVPAVVLGMFAGLLILNSSVQWAVLAGLSVAALALAAVFGLIAREPSGR